MNVYGNDTKEWVEIDDELQITCRGLSQLVWACVWSVSARDGFNTESLEKYSIDVLFNDFIDTVNDSAS